MFPFLHLYLFDLSVYNLCLGLGFISGIILFLINSKTVMKKSDQDTMLAISGFTFVFALLCAFIHNKIVNFISWHHFFCHFFDYTGLAYLGGLIGGISIFCILSLMFLRTKYRLIMILNILTPSLLVGHIIGRIGCLMGGCCYGLPSKNFGIVFSVDTPAYVEYGSIPLIPTQLLEIFLLSAILFIVYRHKKYSFSLYLILYSFGRFFLEFLRGDSRGKGLLTLTPAQTICILLFLIGNYLLLSAKFHFNQNSHKLNSTGKEVLNDLSRMW